MGRIIVIFLFLTAGAMVNTVVAYRCALLGQRQFPMRSFAFERVFWINKALPVPLDPVWVGFVFNAMFYAFLLWLIFAATSALRRRRRIKRGLCPKCAYPVGTHHVCTECGAAVITR